MNRDVRRRWVEALRSGDYVRGRGNLTRADATGALSYCCLGVLCDLAAREGVCDVRVTTRDGRPLVLYDGQSSYLPLSVVRWAGLDAGDVDPAVAGFPMSTRNDQLGEPFARVADLIEAHL